MPSPDVPLNVPPVTLTMPVTWFPQHRGKVIGFIASGFGLASTGGKDNYGISGKFSQYLEKVLNYTFALKNLIKHYGQQASLSCVHL